VSKTKQADGGSTRTSFLTFSSTALTRKGWLFLRPEFCVEAVVLTVSTRELRTDRRKLSLSAAVSRRRDSVATHSAGLLGRWLAVESVVRWPIRGDGPTHREAVHAARRIILTNSLYGHHQRRRPPRRASPHTRSEGTARRSVEETHHPYSSRTVGSRVVVVAIACSNKR